MGSGWAELSKRKLDNQGESEESVCSIQPGGSPAIAKTRFALRNADAEDGGFVIGEG
jgi:hypothetical protein